jgi:biotin operon repressor
LANEKRDVELFNLWLACYTQEEIAEATGITRTGVERVLTQIESFRFASKVGQFYEIADEKEQLDGAR